MYRATAFTADSWRCIYMDANTHVAHDVGAVFPLTSPLPICEFEPAAVVAPKNGTRLGGAAARAGQLPGAPTALSWALGDLRLDFPTGIGAPTYGLGPPTFALESLHDGALGVDCGADIADDGVLRCLPAAAATYYTDAACTTLAVATTGLGYAREGSTLYGLGQALPVPARAYTVASSGACIPVGLPNPAAYAWYERGAAIPASTFVALTPEYR